MQARIRRHSDALIAASLAFVLSAIWAWRDWGNLSALRLPDTDDIMRLQQIRDWLAGQSYFDLAQHRLDGGLQMHWSRLADLVPGAINAVLTPLAGAHAAELTAILIWPDLLFALALFLTIRIARLLGGERIAATAGVVAGIAYPATTIFLPGRIDHHGLQIVLLLAALLAMLGPGVRQRALAGLACAASLAVGLETAPLLGVIGLVALIDWIVRIDEDGERLAGFATGAFVGLVVARVAFAGSNWTYPACDGFTLDLWTAALILTAVPIMLAGTSAFLTTFRHRLVAAIVGGGFALGLALTRSPDCLAPYGHVDPLLARLWLHRVGEAQSMLAAPAATVIGYTGVMLAGLAATLWQCYRTRARGWLILAALQVAALAITAVQLRGAYAGAMLAAPGLAAVIAAARARGGARLAGAWLASAGMLYPIAAQALVRHTAEPAPRPGDCASPAALAALAALPTGTVIAPIDTGPAILATSRHRVLAAPYHRDTAGNLAMFRLYRGAAGDAAQVADAARATYVMACSDLPGRDDPRSAAAALATGALPGFHRVALATDGTTIFARNRLSWSRLPL